MKSKKKQAPVSRPQPPAVPVTTKPAAFANHYTDLELAQMRGMTTRNQSRERQLKIGPPWVRDGRKIYYPIAAWQEYLRQQERRPLRQARGLRVRGDATRP
jgi:hypothetical protein